MSGLVGLYYPDGRKADPSSVERMTRALAHRGKDGGGIWHDGPVGFGHRMCLTTPESLHETLPYYDPVRRLAITADARIDNRGELIDALGVTDQSLSDSMLILLAYDRWGEVCPEKLLGDFAFVIWDGRQKIVFGARDHSGARSLHYYHSPGRVFACASEIKGLVCLADLPRVRNETRVGDYLVGLVKDKESTFYRDILRLPPGHRLTVSPQGAKREAYWSLDPTRSLEGRSDEEYAEEFRQIFFEAVRARLRCAFPVGSTLSGGLDSSSVACTARSLIGQQAGLLHTFSLVFDGVRVCDEQSYIHTVLQQNGLLSHFVPADQTTPMGDYDKVLPLEDEPFLAPNLFLIRRLYEDASKNNVRVVLDGLDGDSTVFHGEGYLTELVRAGRIWEAARELRATATNGRMPWTEALKGYVLPPLVPDWFRKAYRHIIPRGGPAQLMPCIRPEFARRIGLLERIRESESRWGEPPKTVRDAHWRRLAGDLLPFLLEVVDRAAQPFGLEPRYPFFDKRLLEFCLALPAQQKMSGGYTRVVLRRAMEGILPGPIQWRAGKTDMTPHFMRALLVHDRERLGTGIQACMPALEEYVDMHKLKELYTQATLPSPGSDNRIIMMTLWRTVTLGLWLLKKSSSQGDE